MKKAKPTVSMCKAVSLFFFSSRRRHTRSLCDWSSDVCSSDLRRWDRRRGFRRPARNLVAEGLDPSTYRDPSWSNEPYAPDKLYTAVVMGVDKQGVTAPKIGRASCRERGWGSVVAGTEKKKKRT